MTRGLIDDVRTVLWKERRSVLRQPGGRLRALMALAVPVAFIGFVLPIQVGADVATDPVLTVIGVFVVPMLVIMLVLPDAVAGERERHTLVPLLATRLSDRALLIGKSGFAMAYAWLGTVGVFAVALVVANLADRDAAPFFYRPLVAVTIVTLSLALTLLMAPVGVLVSLRATTVQQAQQVLAAALLVPAVLLQVVAVFLLGREDGPDLKHLLEGVEPGVLLGGALVVLGLGAAFCWRLVLRRFRREALVLGHG